MQTDKSIVWGFHMLQNRSQGDKYFSQQKEVNGTKKILSYWEYNCITNDLFGISHLQLLEVDKGSIFNKIIYRPQQNFLSTMVLKLLFKNPPQVST